METDRHHHTAATAVEAVLAALSEAGHQPPKVLSSGNFHRLGVPRDGGQREIVLRVLNAPKHQGIGFREHLGPYTTPQGVADTGLRFCVFPDLPAEAMLGASVLTIGLLEVGCNWLRQTGIALGELCVAVEGGLVPIPIESLPISKAIEAIRGGHPRAMFFQGKPPRLEFSWVRSPPQEVAIAADSLSGTFDSAGTEGDYAVLGRDSVDVPFLRERQRDIELICTALGKWLEVFSRYSMSIGGIRFRAPNRRYAEAVVAIYGGPERAWFSYVSEQGPSAMLNVEYRRE